jgi:hypothetical protein
MKDFIYLDTSYLNSFLAQLNGGVVSNISKETQQSRTTTSTHTNTKERTTEFQAGIRSFATAGVRWAPKTGKNVSIALAQLDAGREIISLQMHDNAVDDLVLHLKKGDLLIEDSKLIELNKYILIKSSFKLIDFDFLKNMTTKEFTQWRVLAE